MLKAASSSDKIVDDPLLGRKFITTTQRMNNNDVDDAIGEIRRPRPHRDGHTHTLPPTDEEEKANDEEYNHDEFYKNTVIMNDLLEQFEESMNQEIKEFTEYINDGCSLNESQGIAAVISGCGTPTSPTKHSNHNYDLDGSFGRVGQVLQNDDDDGILSSSSSAIETITDLHTIWNNNNTTRPHATMSSQPKQQQLSKSTSSTSPTAAANIDVLPHPIFNLEDRGICKREKQDEYKRKNDTTPKTEHAATATAAASIAAESTDYLHNKKSVVISQKQQQQQQQQQQQRVVMDFPQQTIVTDDQYFINPDPRRRSHMKSSTPSLPPPPPIHTINGTFMYDTNLNNDTDSIISAISEISYNPSSINYFVSSLFFSASQDFCPRVFLFPVVNNVPVVVVLLGTPLISTLSPSLSLQSDSVVSRIVFILISFFLPPSSYRSEFCKFSFVYL